MATQATPTIHKTTNYAQFQLMKGNRAVDYNHVKRLKRSIQADPSLLQNNPILVNEHMFIIDGQHRRQAAQELGLELYYTIAEGHTLEATRLLNSTQKRWTLLDFARSYADSGRTEYKEFLRLHEKYPRIAPGIIRLYLRGKKAHGLSDDFKRGEFEIDDLDKAEANLEKLDRVMKAAHLERINQPMASALLSVFRDNEDFDFERFVRKLEQHEGAQERFIQVGSVRGNLRSIEDVYNFQSKTQTRLY